MAHRARKFYGRADNGGSSVTLSCTCGSWTGVRGALERDQREAHRQHRIDMGEEVQDRKDSNRCFHCGRKTGGTQGGYATIDNHLVCHPTVPDRPDCATLVSVDGEELGSRKHASPEEAVTAVQHVARRFGCEDSVCWGINGEPGGPVEWNREDPPATYWAAVVRCSHATPFMFGGGEERWDVNRAVEAAADAFIRWHETKLTDA
jgi:hypothetical protein